MRGRVRQASGWVVAAADSTIMANTEHQGRVGETVMVHLLGLPAVGKYTVAKELATRWGDDGGRMIVVDNHHVNNVVLALLDGDGRTELPARVWQLTQDVRATVLEAIEELAPPAVSYVFTNFLAADNPRHAASLDRVAEVAAARGSTFVPVRLHCDADEISRRADRVDRRARLKWTDAAAVRDFAIATRLIEVSHQSVLDLDVTHLSPSEAVASIIVHIRSTSS
jgi:hypothetical protein